MNQTPPPTTALDTFVCIHHRDVDYLLETVLRSYEANFHPKGRLFMITNDPARVQRFLDENDFSRDIMLSADADWLSKKELELPGWYRQQLIKLRSYEFCETANFCNLGADTVLLQPIFYDDLVDDTGFPILYYTGHTLPDQHVRYERERIRNISRMLQVEPKNALLYTDFINDLFTFNRETLRSLDAYLKRLYGDEPYVRLLQNLDDHSANRNKFGEWTLYSVYMLDVLKRPLTMQNTRPDFLYQVHGRLSLYLCGFDTKVVHFVGKNFDVDHIKAQISRSQSRQQPQLQPELQQHF